MIQCELSSDRYRGRDHGILRVTGLQELSGPVYFSLMRNQGSERWLGTGGVWQSTCTWLSASDVETVGTTLLIQVGADVVEPIVSQPTNVVFRLFVAVGAERQAGVLRIVHPLLGSGAAGSPLEAGERAGEGLPQATRIIGFPNLLAALVVAVLAMTCAAVLMF